jgi:hypothetical protein
MERGKSTNRGTNAEDSGRHLVPCTFATTFECFIISSSQVSCRPLKFGRGIGHGDAAANGLDQRQVIMIHPLEAASISALSFRLLIVRWLLSSVPSRSAAMARMFLTYVFLTASPAL